LDILYFPTIEDTAAVSQNPKSIKTAQSRLCVIKLLTCIHSNVAPQRGACRYF